MCQVSCFYAFALRSYYEEENGGKNMPPSGWQVARRPSDRRVNPRRHSPFRHPSPHRGGGWDPPRDWLLSELELRFKNQRDACHETKSMTSEIKALAQPVTSEVRSMTQKWSKCDFALTSFSEQARAAIYDQNVPNHLRNTMQCLLDPYGPFWGSKLKKKIVSR